MIFLGIGILVAMAILEHTHILSPLAQRPDRTVAGRMSLSSSSARQYRHRVPRKSAVAARRRAIRTGLVVDEVLAQREAGAEPAEGGGASQQDDGIG